MSVKWQDMVLDTSILLLYLRQESGYKSVEELLVQAQKNKIALFSSDITLMEVYYQMIRELGKDEADKYLANIQKLPITFVAITKEILTIAALFKARGGISVADGIIAATAKVNNVPLLTKDPEFKLLAEELTIELL